jgi:hypothetical protein
MSPDSDLVLLTIWRDKASVGAIDTAEQIGDRSMTASAMTCNHQALQSSLSTVPAAKCVAPQACILNADILLVVGAQSQGQLDV